MSESNALLAKRIQQHDEGAFAVLFSRYHAIVFRVCLKFLGHREDAEDATQETFSRAARYLHRWDSRRPLEPWLVAIAGNRCRTFLASKRGHRSLSPAVEPLTNEADARYAEDWLREEIDLALSQLPFPQRRAFDLFHRQSLSYQEIAAQLDCPIGTVKTWIHRARQQVIGQLVEREVVYAMHQTRGKNERNAASYSEALR